MLEDDSSFSDNLDETLAPRATPRVWARRLLLALATVVAGAVVLVLLTNQQQFTSLPPHGAHYVVHLSSDATWGTFSVTGGAAPVTFTYSGFSVSTALIQAPATLNITFTAAPFAPVKCRLTLPPAPTDTCRSLTPFTDLKPDDLGIITVPIHFRLTSDDLPRQIKQVLIQTVEQSVLAATPQITVPPGSHYAVGGILTAHYVAQQRLTATLTTRRSLSAQTIPDQGCLTLCGINSTEGNAAPGDHIWHAQVYIDQQWQISDLHGTILGIINESTVSRPLDIDLRFDTTTQQWFSTLKPDLGQGMCDDGDVFLTGFFFVPNSGFANYATSPHYTDHLLQGCLLHLSTTDGKTVADFLWRLGSLYAVNAPAHVAAPTLTIANDYDLTALG